MEVMQAIHQRRATRNYTDKTVSTEALTRLLDAAVQAPSAVNLQPWAFAVVQDRRLLSRLSDQAKTFLLETDDQHLRNPDLRKMISDPAFNIFYNAGTLIVIYAKPVGAHPDWDCCLAAQNLMLAAEGMGLATCPIGFAWDVLEKKDVKIEMGIPREYKTVFPLIVGYPKGAAHRVDRKPPEILCWRTLP